MAAAAPATTASPINHSSWLISHMHLMTTSHFLVDERDKEQ